MATLGLTTNIKYKSELHDKIADAVRDRIRASQSGRKDFLDKWRKAEENTVAYMPERDVDALRRLERENSGKPQYTTIKIPYTYALLMSAHTYWTTVFLSRNPVFQYSGRHGESEMQIQGMEALMDYQIQVGKNLVPLYIWLYDMGKYGHGVVGCHWEKKFATVSEIVEQTPSVNGVPTGGKPVKVKQARRITGYQGNKLSNIRPHDFFPDPRFPLHNFQDGEFCAVLNPAVSFNRLLEAEVEGRYTNVKELRANVSRKERITGSAVSDLPDTRTPDLDRFSKLSAETAELYECYIELIPNDWGLGTGKLPEKWVFTISSDYSVVIGAQPLGAYHNQFPFAVMEMEPEGYAMHSRGLSDIVEPLQNTIDWLINSHFYNVRKTLNNQWIGDPSRLVMKDVQNPLPGGFIRLKPSAYGQDPKTVIAQLPVQDLTRTHVNDVGLLMQLGDQVSGISQLLQGAQAPSSRRSAAEVRSSTTFGVSRMKAVSEFASAMGWSPLSQMMVQNTQQYLDSEMKLKIVGDLALMTGPRFLDVTPELITGFYDFVPIDGTLPADRFAQASLWSNMFAQIKQFPQILMQYDIGKIFAWVAQLAGLKNINQFKIEVVSDDQIAAAAQQGSVVPLRGELGEQPLLNQVPGTGQTI